MVDALTLNRIRASAMEALGRTSVRGPCALASATKSGDVQVLLRGSRAGKSFSQSITVSPHALDEQISSAVWAAFRRG